ncbi:MAG: 50S ribosomal protein L5 [Candidatus Micrarchaeota archaeon]
MTKEDNPINLTNPMRQIVLEKVTINIGVGSPGERLDGIKTFMEKLIGKKFIETKAKKRNPVFKLRVGLPIGLKTTLRGAIALDFLNKALDSIKRKINKTNFDKNGNFAFGVKECIDFPKAKYDPKVGVFGFDVCVTLKRKGQRIRDRMKRASKIPKVQFITKEEAINFTKTYLNAKVEDEVQ